jgi:hypothetical protein
MGQLPYLLSLSSLPTKRHNLWPVLCHSSTISPDELIFIQIKKESAPAIAALLGSELLKSRNAGRSGENVASAMAQWCPLTTSW